MTPHKFFFCYLLALAALAATARETHARFDPARDAAADDGKDKLLAFLRVYRQP